MSGGGESACTGAGDLGPLVAEGVAPWLDGVHRELILSGRLARLVRNFGLRGALVDLAGAAALHRDPAYAEQLARLAGRNVSAESAVWALAACDLVLACDDLAPVFRGTHGHDGWVAADLSPRMAHDRASIIAEAVELVQWVGRANLVVAIPATDEGLEAIRDCVARGIGVQAAGVFSPRRYAQAVDAYLDGLECALAAGRRISAVAALASVPVGALDLAVDRRLDALGTDDARALRGRTAQAVARLMYRAYEGSLDSARWRTLRAAGARPLRLLWTGSDTGSPPLSRSRYVEGLVSWGTAHAMTPAVLDEAARSMRLDGDTLTDTAGDAEHLLDALAGLGIRYDAVARRLEADWVTGRVDAWRRLHQDVEERLGEAVVTRSVPPASRGR